MHQVKGVKLKFYSIFMIAFTAVLLAACSGNSTGGTSSKTEVATAKTVQDEKEIKDNATDESVEETKPQDDGQPTEKIQEKPAVPSNAEETIKLDDFINRWNEIDPGKISGETKTISVEKGILTGMGNLGGGDSFVFEINEKDQAIKQVSLNLTYPLPDDGGGLGEEISHNISVLMDVLEPELSKDKKENMLSTIQSSDVADVSVKEGKVTYTVRNGDDRFWLDATFTQE